MKKIALACMVALGLASCANDETVLEQNDANRINFTVTTEGTSRATDIYCPNNMITSFNVSATNGTATFFDGDVFTQSGGKWTGSVTRYWPTGGTLSFYAYVNDGGTFTWDPTAAPTFTDFSPATTVADQTDLLYAVAADQSKPATTNPNINLNFRHALSQVVFKAKNTNPNLYVEIYGVSVCQVNSKGTFTFPTTSTDTNIAHGATSGDPVQGTWVNTTDVANYSVDLAAATPVVCIKGDSGNTSTVVNLTDYAAAADGAHADGENQFGNAMLLLPQTGNACAITTAQVPTTGVYFVVKCKIWNVATPGADGTKSDSDILLYPAGDSATAEAADVLIPVSINWQQGMKYIYTFVFGTGNGGWTPGPDPKPVLVPISFDVTVDEFVPVVNADTDMQTPTNS